MLAGEEGMLTTMKTPAGNKLTTMIVPIIVVVARGEGGSLTTMTTHMVK